MINAKDVKKKRKNIEFKEEDKKIISSTGIDLEEKQRIGSFLQEDNIVKLYRSLYPKVEILPIEEAIKEPKFKNYFGKGFKFLNKEFPKDTKGGYFIRVKENTKIDIPIQACLFLKTKKFYQRIHNLIVIEKNSQVYLITGCSSSNSAQEASHLGVSEFFIKKGAYLNFTMVHSWSETVKVKPISVALVEENATFVSNYVCLKPVKEIVMYPTAVLLGKSARASFNSLILSHPRSFQDIGSRVIFKENFTQAEIISRAVSLGGKIIARGHLKAQVPNVKAHLECRGLILSPKGFIYAIPELETTFRDVDMSHEAAIGKISQEEIEYLCSRGFSRKEAQSIIIRGFMDVDILGLPQSLKLEIEKLEETTLSKGF